MIKHSKIRLIIVFFFLLCCIFFSPAYTQQFKEPTEEKKQEIKRLYKKYKKAKSKYDKKLKKYTKAADEAFEWQKQNLKLTDQMKKNLLDAYDKVKIREYILTIFGQRLIDYTAQFWFLEDDRDFTPRYHIGEYFGVTRRNPNARDNPKDSRAFIGNLAFSSPGMLFHVILHEKVHWRDLKEYSGNPFEKEDIKSWYEKRAYKTSIEQDMKFKLLTVKEMEATKKVFKKFEKDWKEKKESGVEEPVKVRDTGTSEDITGEERSEERPGVDTRERSIVKPEKKPKVSKRKRPAESTGDHKTHPKFGFGLFGDYSKGMGAGGAFTLNLQEKGQERERTDLRASFTYQPFNNDSEVDISSFIFSLDIIQYLTPGFYLIGGIEYAIVNKDEEPNKYLGFNVGGGIEFNVGKKLNFFVQGTYNILYDKDLYDEDLSSISVKFGLRYSLFSRG